MSKKAYILVGVPGSGKTTWAKSQTWIENFEYISTDEIVDSYSKEIGKTYSEVFNEYMPTAVKIMVKKVQEAREQEKDIIWDQTSTTVLSRTKKFNMLPDYYHIAVIFRTPIRDVLTERLNNRPGKIIPEDVINNMIDNFEEPTENEGYKELWYVN